MVSMGARQVLFGSFGVDGLMDAHGGWLRHLV